MIAAHAWCMQHLTDRNGVPHDAPWEDGVPDAEQVWYREWSLATARAALRQPAERHDHYAQVFLDVWHSTHPIRAEWHGELPPGAGWPEYVHRTERGWEVLGHKAGGTAPCPLSVALAVWGPAIEGWVADLRALGEHTTAHLRYLMAAFFPERCPTHGDAGGLLQTLVDHGVCERVGSDPGADPAARLCAAQYGRDRFANETAAAVFRPLRHPRFP